MQEAQRLAWQPPGSHRLPRLRRSRAEAKMVDIQEDVVHDVDGAAAARLAPHLERADELEAGAVQQREDLVVAPATFE